MDFWPLELVHGVLGHLVPDYRQQLTLEERDTLRSACLVHSTWRAKLQPALFKLVGESRSPAQLALLLAAIEQQPRLATYIYELQVGNTETWLPDSNFGTTLDALLRLCTAAGDISIHLGDQEAVEIPLSSLFSSPKLVELSLVGSLKLSKTKSLVSAETPGYLSVSRINVDIDECPSLSPAIRTIIRAPNLRTLSFGTGNYEGDEFHSLADVFDFDFSKISRLDVSRVPDLDLDWEEDIIRRFSTLDTLCLDILHLPILFTPELAPTVHTLHIDLDDYDDEEFAVEQEAAEVLEGILLAEPRREFLPELATLVFIHESKTLADLIEAGIVSAELQRLCEIRGVKVLAMTKTAVS